MTKGFDRNSWLNPYCVALKPLTEVSEPWHIREVKDLLPDDRSPQQWMLQLENNNVIEKVERIRIDNRPVWEYEFNPRAEEFITQRSENVNKLPCGCRAHIPSDVSANTDTGTCKNCGATHSKETFKNTL